MRSEENARLHEAYIRAMAGAYESGGYTDIKADHIACENGKPDKVVSFVPDVSARGNGGVVICEAETAETLWEEHTVAEWKLYDQSGHEFHVALPKGSIPDAEEMARRHGITVDRFWGME